MGFQTARQQFNDSFSQVNDEIKEMLMELWSGDKYIPATEISRRTREILKANDVNGVVYDTAWETIYLKAKPMVADDLVDDGMTKSAWLLAFLIGWDSFGRKLPSRIRNTSRLIREGYEKNTKRIYRDVFKATQKQDINSKILGRGLSRSVKKRYAEIERTDPRRASKYLDEQFGKMAGWVADAKNKKLPQHYANRMVETEALTIRMDLAMKSAGESGDIDYITISVKPKACSTCQSFIGVQYKYGYHPHLLAHPSCRCDYILHYVNGKTLTIAGSGRVDLIT